jgi:hypothetical protein
MLSNIVLPKTVFKVKGTIMQFLFSISEEVKCPACQGPVMVVEGFKPTDEPTMKITYKCRLDGYFDKQYDLSKLPAVERKLSQGIGLI